MWRALAGARRLLRPIGAAAGGVLRAEPPPSRAPPGRGCSAAGGGAGPGALGAAERRQPADTVLPKFNIDLVVALLRQENAKDICVIQLSPEIKYCDYFIIVSGFSTRHLHALANYMLKMNGLVEPFSLCTPCRGTDLVMARSESDHASALSCQIPPALYKHLKEDGSPRTQIEGKETDDWLCIDFGHIVVHFMLPETREVYELEKLWTLGPYDDQLAQMTPQPLPKDFIFGLTPNSSDHLETRT